MRLIKIDLFSTFILLYPDR